MKRCRTIQQGRPETIERCLVKAKMALVLLELTTSYDILIYRCEAKELDSEIDKLKRVNQLLCQKMGTHENAQLAGQIMELKRELSDKNNTSQRYKELTQVNAQQEETIRKLTEEKKAYMDASICWQRKFKNLETVWQPMAIQLNQCKDDNEAHCKAIGLQIEQHNILTEAYLECKVQKKAWSDDCKHLEMKVKELKEENEITSCKNSDLATHNLRLVNLNSELREQMDKECKALMQRNTDLVLKSKNIQTDQTEFNNLKIQTKEQKNRIFVLENVNRKLTENTIQASKKITDLTEEYDSLLRHISGEIS